MLKTQPVINENSWNILQAPENSKILKFQKKLQNTLKKINYWKIPEFLKFQNFLKNYDAPATPDKFKKKY
jgi:hypothetical protein